VIIDTATEATYDVTAEGVYTVQVTVDVCVSAVSEAFDFVIVDPVDPIAQTITFDELPNKTLGDDAFIVAASASSDLAVSFSTTSDKISIDGDVVTLVSAGRASIDASQAGDDIFAAATPVSQSFCINPMKPVITVGNDNSENVTLTSSVEVGNQWFLNGILIENATTSTIEVLDVGIYTVQVTVDDCVGAISDDLALIVTSVNLGGRGELIVYPNPTSEYIQINGFKGDVKNLTLFDLSGKQQFIQFTEENSAVKANIQQIPNGIYILMIQGTEVTQQLRIIKN